MTDVSGRKARCFGCDWSARGPDSFDLSYRHLYSCSGPVVTLVLDEERRVTFLVMCGHAFTSHD